MKRRVVSFIMVAILALSLCGCGKISNDKITIKKYKGLEVQEVTPVEVSDEDVENSIASTLQMMAEEIEIKDRAAEEGDTVHIAYSGTYEGEEFDAGDDLTVELGSGQTVPGFEDGIIGHNIGDNFQLEITFPESYGATTKDGESLAGADVKFDITLNKIVQYDVPELTEELLPELSETAATVDEFKAEVKADLEESNKLTAESEFENTVWEALLENCEMKDYPESKYDEYYDELETTYGYLATLYGYELDKFIPMMYGIELDELIENMICQEYAIELIAEEEGLEVTLEDYEAGLEKYAEMYGYDDVKEFEESYGEEEFTQALLQEKVAKVLMDNCKIVSE